MLNVYLLVGGVQEKKVLAVMKLPKASNDETAEGADEFGEAGDGSLAWIYDNYSVKFNFRFAIVKANK